MLLTDVTLLTDRTVKNRLTKLFYYVATDDVETWDFSLQLEQVLGHPRLIFNGIAVTVQRTYAQVCSGVLRAL